MSEDYTAKALMARVWELSERLKRGKISHDIRGFRYDGISILAHVPGEYWEIDFLENGQVDVEVYRTTGPLETESAIERLLKEYSEPNEEEKKCP